MIVAKAIQNITATTVTDLDSNYVLNLTYEIKYNYNTVNFEFDNYYQYINLIPVKIVSLNMGYNIDDNMESVEVNYGNKQLLFTKGEYYNIGTGQTLDVGLIYSLISGEIYNL
jgi:hypothetical protein